MMAFLSAMFDAPVRRAVAALWFVGAALATLAAVLEVRPSAVPPWVFLIPTTLLLLLAFTLLAARVWAMAVSFVLLTAQVAGVIGAMLELVYGIDARKAAELHTLRFDPTLGVSINLAFSVAAVGILVVSFVRVVFRLRSRRLAGPDREGARHDPRRCERRRGDDERARDSES